VSLELNSIEGAQRVPLAELGRWTGGGTPSKSRPEYWSGSIPWVSPKDMKVGRIRDAEDHISEAAVRESSTNVVPAGSILMVTRSGILSRTFPVAVTDAPVALNQDLKALTPRSDVDPSYVYWALRALEREILNNCSKDGTTVASIDTSRLMRIEIPVPHLGDQRRIVSAIEERLIRLDAAISSLDASESRSAKLASAVLQACLGGCVIDQTRPDQPKLAGIPVGWKSCRMDEVIKEARYGTSTKCQYEGLGVKVLRIPNIRNRRLDWGEIKRAVDTAEDLSRLYVRAGDVLVIRTNGSRSLIGKVGLVDNDYNVAFASYLIRLKPNLAHVKPAYLVAVLSSPSYRALIAARAATTAGQYNISIPALMSLPVPVPSLETQEQLIATVERLEERIDSASRRCTSAGRRARSLRKAILRAAFTGRLPLEAGRDQATFMSRAPAAVVR